MPLDKQALDSRYSTTSSDCQAATAHPGLLLGMNDGAIPVATRIEWAARAPPQHSTVAPINRCYKAELQFKQKRIISFLISQLSLHLCFARKKSLEHDINLKEIQTIQN